LKIAASAALAVCFVVGIACQVTNTKVSDPVTAPVSSSETTVTVTDAAAAPAPAPEAEAAPTGVAPELQAAPAKPRADGAACSEAGQCSSGICEGEGCGTDQGHCAAKSAPCTRDLVTYCGCDGKAFQASGSCAGERFAHRGACSATGAK
jgi:hypothetical protein